MRGTCRVYPAGVSEKSEKPGTGREGQVALMSHAAAHALISQWAAVELNEIRNQWYPRAAMGYRDYEPPKDPEERQDREMARVERDWDAISRTGWVILSLPAVHRASLLRFYRGANGRVAGGARNAALAAFVRRWAIWSEAVDGPLNSI